jgi:putative glutamine amidotransferase
MVPQIAVLMDENTSSGGTRYEAHKGYFNEILTARGAPFGIPYAQELVSRVVREFDGFLAVGGRFAYPSEWYVDGHKTQSPHSDRLEVERSLMTSFLDAGKPVLGICAGMQMMACLHGSKLIANIETLWPSALPHDKKDWFHPITILDDTLLRRVVGTATVQVNSFHREAIAEVGVGVTVSARAEDGIIEAIELPSYSFALGIQWHQELLTADEHPARKIFTAFVDACRKTRSR